MKRYRLDPKKPRQLTPEEQERLDKARIDYSDIPPLGDEFFSKAKQAWPPAKQQLTIRLDSDVVEWLRTHGRGYQTRINRILRAAMESQTAQNQSARTPRPRSRTPKTRGGPSRS
jgi:uncharacterized protein (DUF4415 family)